MGGEGPAWLASSCRRILQAQRAGLRRLPGSGDGPRWTCWPESRPASPGGSSLLAGRTLPGSILIVRAAAVDPKTPFAVLKQTDSFRIALGENNGQSFYLARLNMKSTEAVAQVKTIAEGFRALVSLNKGIDPEALQADRRPEGGRRRQDAERYLERQGG